MRIWAHKVLGALLRERPEFAACRSCPSRRLHRAGCVRRCGALSTWRSGCTLSAGSATHCAGSRGAGGCCPSCGGSRPRSEQHSRGIQPSTLGRQSRSDQHSRAVLNHVPPEWLTGASRQVPAGRLSQGMPRQLLSQLQGMRWCAAWAASCGRPSAAAMQRSQWYSATPLLPGPDVTGCSRQGARPPGAASHSRLMKWHAPPRVSGTGLLLQPGSAVSAVNHSRHAPSAYIPSGLGLSLLTCVGACKGPCEQM